MMLEPERAAAMLAERLRRSHPQGGWRDGATWTTLLRGAGKPKDNAAGERDWLVQRTLEELGIHCESADTLQDLKGFLIASPRGAEIVVSERLTPDERLAVYAHLLAHAVLEELPGEASNFFSQMEYVEGREPEPQSGAERRTKMVANALAQAILRGHLDGAPQYVYRRSREPARNVGLRPALGRFFLEVCHRTSLALFWHSPKYQKLRSRPEMTFLVRRLQDLVRVAYAC